MSNQSERDRKAYNVRTVNVLTAELSVEIDFDSGCPRIKGFEQMKEILFLELQERDKEMSEALSSARAEGRLDGLAEAAEIVMNGHSHYEIDKVEDKFREEMSKAIRKKLSENAQ